MSNGTVSADPQLGIRRLLKLVKGRSSRLVRQEFPVLKRQLAVVVDELVFLCDHWGGPLSVIKQYLEQQKHV